MVVSLRIPRTKRVQRGSSESCTSVDRCPWCLRMVSKRYCNWSMTRANAVVAGGQAVDSKMRRMITVVPEHIHDRSGIFLGSYDEVQKVIDMHKKHGIT